MKIQSVAFGPGQIEISFVQDHNVGDFGMVIETAVFSDELVEGELLDVLEALESLVTAWQTIKRNPPDRVRARDMS